MGENEARAARSKLTAVTGVLCVATFVAFICKNTVEALSPSLVLGFGGNMAEAGVQGSAFFIASIVMRFVFAPIADARGNKAMIALGLALLGAGGVIGASCTQLWQITAARCVQAADIASFYPSAASLVSTIAPAGAAGTCLGAFRLAASLPMLFGPGLFLQTAQSTGFGACFAAMGFASFAALGVVLAGVPSDKRASARAGADAEDAGLGSAASSAAGAGSAAGADAAGAGSDADATRRAEKRVQTRGGFIDTFVQPLLRALSPSNKPYLAALALAFIASAGFAVVTNFAVIYAAGTNTPLNSALFFLLFGIGGLVANPVAGHLQDTQATAPAQAGQSACRLRF